MTESLIRALGPLAALAGTWEGDKGDDTAPSDDLGIEKNRFRERMEFVPFGPVDNHQQKLYGLKYSTTAWRLGEENSFHEEVGYWLWDAAEKQVLRCFIVPRGVTVLAGGKVEPNATTFTLSAEAGSPVYGICSNPFLDREFKTVRYDLKITVQPELGILTYEEDSQLELKGRETIFHHVDKNTLRKLNIR